MTLPMRKRASSTVSCGSSARRRRRIASFAGLNSGLRRFSAIKIASQTPGFQSSVISLLLPLFSDSLSRSSGGPRQSIRESAESSRGRGVGRLVVEESGEFGVLDDHGRIALDGVKVFFLKTVAGFRGHKHFSGEGEGYGGVFGSDGLFGRERFVDAHHEFGDVVQPGELRVIDHQAKQLAGIDLPELAFVFVTLHVYVRFVQAQKG